MKLEKRAMLVKLSIGTWSAKKTDKDATAEVIEKHKAERDVGRFTKKLLGKKAMQDINSIINLARKMHKSLTMPWTDDGQRIIINETYGEYSKILQNLRMQFGNAKKKFLSEVEELIAEHAASMGSLYNPEDYPTLQEIASKFHFDVEIDPIPQATDFRVDLTKDQTKEIVKEIEERANKRAEAAVKDVWRRVYEVTEKMADKLSNYEPPKNGERASNTFSYTLINNVQEMADLLPYLNLNNDPEMTRISDEMNELLCQYTAEELRTDAKARGKTAKSAKAITKKAKQFL